MRTAIDGSMAALAGPGAAADLFVQGPLPDHDQQRLPRYLDTLVAFVRRAWSPPAPTRPLSLQDLAAGACLSAGYFSRVFRQHYGMGPVAAFELLRLARAATLLVRSNLSDHIWRAT
jgi:AraC family transcriptional regulator